MRASTDQVRTATTDAVEAARKNAAGLVSTGADLVTHTLDKGASALEGGIERVSDRAPSLSIGVSRAPRRHRIRSLLIGVAVLAVLLVIARKLFGATDGSTSDAGSHGTADPVPDEDAVPAGSG